jgi:hypothetical protein
MSTETNREGLCDAFIDWGKGAGHQCESPAKWSVLTVQRERRVCGVHVRVLRDHIYTMAVEPLKEDAA